LALALLTASRAWLGRAGEDTRPFAFLA